MSPSTPLRAGPSTSVRTGVYTRDDERAIRAQRLVHDWAASALVTAEQRDRMLADAQVDLRRTNKFLRITLAIFGFVIINSFGGFVAIVLEALGEEILRWVALGAAIPCLLAAHFLVTRYKFYRFGLEEAAAVAGAVFFTIFVAEIGPAFSPILAFSAATVSAAAIFVHFGYVYAGVVATLLAPMIIFDLDFTDTVRRLMAFILLMTIFFIARERREDHDPEHPSDAYAAIETTAWAAMYFFANLKVSSFWSSPDEVPAFYWGTYAVIWMLPIAGLRIAIRDRHRSLLDVNIALAIATLISNKPYLGAAQKPWDPILFGVMLIAVAMGLRRWLASGANGSRGGYIAERILASEQERLALVGTATVLAPGGPEPQTQQEPPSFGGGESGGAGASGKF